MQNAVLEDGTLASDALETGPPSYPNAHITGIYTLANPAGCEEVFDAEVGFYSNPRNNIKSASYAATAENNVFARAEVSIGA